jgi:CheY-like chemotaxis protein
MEISRVHSGGEAVDLASRRRFDLTTATLPLPDMSAGQLVTKLRSLDQTDRFSPIVLLADGPDLEAARSLEIPAVQVLGLGESDSVFRHVISEALGVAARLAVRIPIRLEVGIEAGRSFRFCETRNISRSGILISSSRALPIGSTFRFELTFPYTLAPLSGFAEVVRHTNADVEGTTGFGATFLSLSEEDDVRIQSFIQNELSRSREKQPAKSSSVSWPLLSTKAAPEETTGED